MTDWFSQPEPETDTESEPAEFVVTAPDPSPEPAESVVTAPDPSPEPAEPPSPAVSLPPVDPTPLPQVDPVPRAPTAPASWMDPPPQRHDPSPMPVVTRTEEPTLTAAYDTPPAPTIESLPAPDPQPETALVPEVDLPTATSHGGLLDEVSFDLAYLSTEQRRHLSMRLTGAGVTHRFEVATDLVVGMADAETIEGYLDEVQNPDGFDVAELDAFEEENDVDDEAIYSAMSNLYVAADKLMQRPGDGPCRGTFYLAADDVEGLPAPFGFDPRVWAQVLGLTDSIIGKLDADTSADDIGGDARSLRQLLVNYV